MGISRGKFEWNLNTIIQLATLASIVAGGIYYWTNTERDIEDLQVWRTAHEQLHKDRLVDVKAVEAKNEERFRYLEGEVRKMDQITYRLTVSEQSTANVAEAVKQLQDIVNRQAGDIRLALEILQRLEQRRPLPPP